MNGFASFFFPAFIGLMAGIGHGVYSERTGLPFSLTEQVWQSFTVDRTFNE